MTKEIDQVATVFAQRLSAAMQAKGIKQSALAQMSGVGQTTISLYLRPDARGDSATGKDKGPTLPNVQKIAGALGMEPWELLMPQDTYSKFKAFENFAAQYAQPAAAPAESTGKRRAA